MDYEALSDELEGYMAQVLKHPVPKGSYELSQGEHGVLLYLCRVRDGETPGGLRAALGVGSGRMADTLKSLAAKGYVRRSADERDNRRVLAHITPEGRAYVEARYRRYREEQLRMLRALGDEDAQAFVRIMGRMAALKRCAPD